MKTLLFPVFALSCALCFQVDYLFQRVIESTGNDPRFNMKLNLFWQMVENGNADELRGYPQMLKGICESAGAKEKCKRLSNFIYAPMGPSAVDSEMPQCRLEMHLLNVISIMRKLTLANAHVSDKDGKHYKMGSRLNVSLRVHDRLRDQVQLYAILLHGSSLGLLYRIGWRYVMRRIKFVDRTLDRLLEMEQRALEWVERQSHVRLEVPLPRVVEISNEYAISGDEQLALTLPVREKLKRLQRKCPLPYEIEYVELQALLSALWQLIFSLQTVGTTTFEDLMHWQAVCANAQALSAVICNEMVHLNNNNDQAGLLERTARGLQSMEGKWEYLEGAWDVFAKKLIEKDAEGNAICERPLQKDKIY